MGAVAEHVVPNQPVNCIFAQTLEEAVPKSMNDRETVGTVYKYQRAVKYAGKEKRTGEIYEQGTGTDRSRSE